MSTTQNYKGKRIAVVLSGCGVYDGSETTEAVSILTALSRAETTFQCYAPNKAQHHVINHLKGEEQIQTRNVMEESARIARGNVKDLKDLQETNYDGVIFPGGFGAAKNLSTFATSDHYQLDPEIARVLTSFHTQKKVIGACCIAPVLLAKAFEQQNVQITLGMASGEDWPYKGSIEAAKRLGQDVKELTVGEVLVDVKNKLVTSPAYMYNGQYHEIYDGVQLMVQKILEQTQK